MSLTIFNQLVRRKTDAIKLDEGGLGVIRVFTEMILQGILKLSLENVHTVEIVVKMRNQNSIKKLLLSGLKYVLKNRSEFCAESW